MIMSEYMLDYRMILRLYHICVVTYVYYLK